jgi:uncharacterized protein YxjI
MDRYVIRTAFWRIFGGAFYFEDLDGRVVAYSEQKRFKLKEDIVLFTDESCTVPLVQIKARSILDLGTTYDIFDAQTGINTQGFMDNQRRFWKPICAINRRQQSNITTIIQIHTSKISF